MCICIELCIVFVHIYRKPTCCKLVLHNRHGQSRFDFLFLDLKASKQEHSFIFPGATVQTFDAKKNCFCAIFYCFRNSAHCLF